MIRYLEIGSKLWEMILEIYVTRYIFIFCLEVYPIF
jgi:hypothetical protein